MTTTIRSVLEVLPVEQGYKTYQPFRGTTDVSRGDSGCAVTGRVVGVYWSERDISRVDSKGLTAECQRDASRCRARNCEASLAIRLSTWNGSVDGGSISGGGNDEGGSGVEDSSTTLEPKISSINGNGIKTSFPEPGLADVRDSDKSCGIEFS